MIRLQYPSIHLQNKHGIKSGSGVHYKTHIKEENQEWHKVTSSILKHSNNRDRVIALCPWLPVYAGTTWPSYILLRHLLTFSTYHNLGFIHICSRAFAFPHNWHSLLNNFKRRKVMKYLLLTSTAIRENSTATRDGCNAMAALLAMWLRKKFQFLFDTPEIMMGQRSRRTLRTACMHAADDPVKDGKVFLACYVTSM